MALSGKLGAAAVTATFSGISSAALTQLPFQGNPFRIQGSIYVPVLGNQPGWIGMGLTSFMATLVGETTANTVLPAISSRIPQLNSVFNAAQGVGPALLTGGATWGVLKLWDTGALGRIGGFNAGLLGFTSHMIGLRLQAAVTGTRGA
jgi:hypothetical protein